MMRDCWGWEIGDDLGTGASLTGSIVVVPTAGASVVSLFSEESLAGIRTSLVSVFVSDKGVNEDGGESGVEVIGGPKGP